MNANGITWEAAVQWLREQDEHADLVKYCYFDDPLVDACQRYHESMEWAEIKKWAGEIGDVLDVGAGRGIASYALARDGWRVTALEPDPSALVGASAIRSFSSETGLDIQVVENWGEKLPFKDGSFDLVFCRQVLHHASHLGDFCKEIFRVLRPGGRCLALREHVISKEQDLKRFLDSHPLHSLYGGEHAYLLQEYVDRIKDSGLVILKVLNPYASEINAYPNTRSNLKKWLARKIFWPWPSLLPDLCLDIVGERLQNPGRIYSFICQKPIGDTQCLKEKR